VHLPLPGNLSPLHVPFSSFVFHGGGGAAARIGCGHGGISPDSSLLSSILMPVAAEPSSWFPEGMPQILVLNPNLVVLELLPLYVRSFSEKNLV